jgi:hypothetical protein
MRDKKEQMSVYISSQTIEKLKAEAERQSRSVSNMTELLLEEVLKNKAA